MAVELRHPAKVLVSWVAASLIGWLTAGAILLLAQTLLPSLSGPAPLIVIFMPGAAQWLLLRRLLGIGPLWAATAPLATIGFAGFLAAVPVALWQTVDGEAPATLAAIYGLLGALLGFLQWLALRRLVKPAWVWIVASAVGLAAGLALALQTGLVDRSGMGAYVAAVLIYTATTGVALAWLVGRAAPTPAARLIAA